MKYDPNAFRRMPNGPKPAGFGNVARQNQVRPMRPMTTNPVGPMGGPPRPALQNPMATTQPVSPMAANQMAMNQVRPMMPAATTNQVGGIPRPALQNPMARPAAQNRLDLAQALGRRLGGSYR